jgi:2-dehydropantoate 2-reductase
MRVAILGSGGVGGYFGARLAAAGADVIFVARGAHLAALRERGLRIESPLGHLHLPHVTATGDTTRVGPVDIVFFTVKLYDTASALQMLPPLLGPNTLVIPFQNGVDSVAVLTRAVGREHVAGGTTYVSAVISEPGSIRHTAMNRLVFGPLEGAPPSPALDELVSLAKSAGIDAVLSDHIATDIWTKFARLTVFSGMTAVTRCPIGPVVADPDLFAMLQAALRESIAVGRASQIPFAENIFDNILKSMMEMPPVTKSSMLEDLERGRPLELPWLSGALVRIGEAAGVATPTHRTIVTLLRPHERGRTPV